MIKFFDDKQSLKEKPKMRKLCILTKLLKDKGYCAVGVDTTNGEVIRLVADKDGAAIEKDILDK
jgi:hypothetical protein